LQAVTCTAHRARYLEASALGIGHLGPKLIPIALLASENVALVRKLYIANAMRAESYLGRIRPHLAIIMVAKQY